MKEEIQETEKIITSIDAWESKTKKEGRTKFLDNFLRKPSMMMTFSITCKRQKEDA